MRKVYKCNVSFRLYFRLSIYTASSSMETPESTVNKYTYENPTQLDFLLLPPDKVGANPYQAASNCQPLLFVDRNWLAGSKNSLVAIPHVLTQRDMGRHRASPHCQMQLAQDPASKRIGCRAAVPPS